MDIYDYLKKDHEKVSHLFKLFEKTADRNKKSEIVFLIIKELLIHAETEQQTFYKTLEEYDYTREVALHGEKEHAEIEAAIDDIIGSKSTSKNWDAKVEKLKKFVEHHVKEEEHEIFNQAKKVLSDEDALELKEKMHFLKGEVSVLLD